MKSASLTIPLMIVVLSLTTEQLRATVDFADGNTYDIDYEINDDIRLDYQSPGTGTTVNLLDGGYTFWVNTYEDSILNMSGGLIGSSLSSWGRSRVEVSGGVVGSYLSACDDSQINLAGGTVTNTVYATHNSAVTLGPGVTVARADVSGKGGVKLEGGTITEDVYVCDEGNFELSSGKVNNIDPRDKSHIRVAGGAVEDSLWAFGESDIKITGGDLFCVDARENVRVSFSGGTIGFNGLRGSDETHIDMFGGSAGYFTTGGTASADIFDGHTEALYCSDESSINLYGGTIEENMISTLNSLLTIYGSDFFVDGSAFGYGELESIKRGQYYYEPIRHITGTLSNGTLLDCDFQIGFNGHIVLVPDPDFNDDGQINFKDFSFLASQWPKTDCNETNGWCQECDFDESGAVDSADLMLFSSNWLWKPDGI